ncbi:unnamed protein product [Clonostachys rosea]|uniref:Uncharacterized protein n=1 Tax=Bionectria ochroleuca TaxID=29856 RepID=A0ABY6UZV3_BIOOC|nr:unnamed protein product [Clonostachys rosea]
MAAPQNKAAKSTAEAVIEVYAKEIDTLIKTTRRKHGKSPNVTGGPGTGTPRFFDYWRDALSSASTAIEIGIISVPEYQIDTSFEKLHIYFSTASAHHEDWEDQPCISLTIPGCVSKGDIIKAVANYLYGEDVTPIIHASKHENGLTWGKHLAYGWTWRTEPNTGVPIVDIYCCTPDEFAAYSSLVQPESPSNGAELK